jgi:hypothetical protein
MVIRLLPTDSTKQKSSSKTNSCSALYFMEPECSLLCSQEPAPRHNPEQDESNTLHIQFL